MDKTLLRKFNDKQLFTNMSALAHAHGEDISAHMRQEMKILQLAARDLLQPRPEAIANILERARAI